MGNGRNRKMAKWDRGETERGKVGEWQKTEREKWEGEHQEEARWEGGDLIDWLYWGLTPV